MSIFNRSSSDAAEAPRAPSEVQGLRVKNDGNNVSLDREARLLAENALRFQIASSLMRERNPAWCARPSRRARAHESVFGASVGASGMAAQRARAELLVENLANAETTRTPEGGPYRRKDVVFESVAPWLRRSHRFSIRRSSGQRRGGSRTS